MADGHVASSVLLRDNGSWALPRAVAASAAAHIRRTSPSSLLIQSPALTVRMQRPRARSPPVTPDHVECCSSCLTRSPEAPLARAPPDALWWTFADIVLWTLGRAVLILQQAAPGASPHDLLQSRRCPLMMHAVPCDTQGVSAQAKTRPVSTSIARSSNGHTGDSHGLLAIRRACLQHAGCPLWEPL